jgi:hypothetical protein
MNSDDTFVFDFNARTTTPDSMVISLLKRTIVRLKATERILQLMSQRISSNREILLKSSIALENRWFRLKALL